MTFIVETRTGQPKTYEDGDGYRFEIMEGGVLKITQSRENGTTASVRYLSPSAWVSVDDTPSPSDPQIPRRLL